MRIRYVDEPEPLGTAGAVKHAEELLDERFAVLNGDMLADFDLRELRTSTSSRRTATIALIPVEDPSAYGLVRTDDDGAIEAFLEKPKPEEIDTNQINAGGLRARARGARRIEPAATAPSSARCSRAGRQRPVRRTAPRATGSTSARPSATSRRRATSSTGGRDRGRRRHGPAIARWRRDARPARLVGGRCEVERGHSVGPGSHLGDGCWSAGRRGERRRARRRHDRAGRRSRQLVGPGAADRRRRPARRWTVVVGRGRRAASPERDRRRTARWPTARPSQ